MTQITINNHTYKKQENNMKTFEEWLAGNEYITESFGAEDIFGNAFKKWAGNIEALLIKPDYEDKTKCKDFKEEHNTIIRHVLSECNHTLKMLGYTGMGRGKVEISQLITQLSKLYERAKDNAYQSKMPGGCGIPSGYTSRTEPGVAEKLQDLSSHIRYLIEDLQKLDFTSNKPQQPSAKEPEANGLMSKLFGKKGWLNPDAYARPIKRPQPRLPRL